MKLKSKICGISDEYTLKYLIEHKNPPQFIGFIVNYPKSKRYVELEKLKTLIKVDKKNSLFVAVLVKPSKKILENIKSLNFDYYQIYDTPPHDVALIKKNYKKKIITALTINNMEDVNNHKNYKDVTDIYLFDSKGYELSLSFDHKLIKNLDLKKEIMIAGNISYKDNLEKYKKIADIIDISGGLETSGLKDVSKIEIFLNRVKNLNDET
tara:strand:- start:652 stop:1281 length:630 start_codon:yes stop_codon:yes gene_type:complete